MTLPLGAAADHAEVNKNLDSCLRRNDQRTMEWYMGTYKEPRVQQAAHPTWKNTSLLEGRKVGPRGPFTDAGLE